MMRKLSINCNGLRRYLVGNWQASNVVEGCIDIDGRAGRFHLHMAACRMLYDAHGGSDGCRNLLSLTRLGGILGRTKVFSATGHMDFYAADALLRHVMDALIIVAVIAHIKVRSVEEMRTQMTSLDWHTTITNIVKKWIPPTSGHFNYNEKTIEERNALLENAVLVLQHSLIYRALGNAVAQGDSGRIVKQLQMLTKMFHGRRQSNYAINSLECFAGMLKTWSDDLKRVWLNHYMVNLSGREGKWIEMDRFNEQLVCYIKEVYNPRGTPASN